MKSLVISWEGFGRCTREHCVVSAVPYVHKKINSQVSKRGMMMRYRSDSDTVGRGKCHRLKQCLDSCWILKRARIRDFFFSFNERRIEGFKKFNIRSKEMSNCGFLLQLQLSWGCGVLCKYLITHTSVPLQTLQRINKIKLCCETGNPAVTLVLLLAPLELSYSLQSRNPRLT